MRMRLGFFVRLAAALAIFIMATQVALAWLYIKDRGDGDEPGYRFPLPERTAAIVQIIEGSHDIELALVAVNTPNLRVDIVEEEIFEFVAPETRLSNVERQFEDYAQVFNQRPFAIFADIPDDVDPAELRWGDRSVWTEYPMRVLVGLDVGRVLSIETRDDLLTQVYFVPLGWFSGILGTTASLIVLFFVRRETKPIEKLAHAVEQFGSEGKPVVVTAQGAPELRSLIKNFNAMQTRISDLMDRQIVMLGALGHDMRTYLTRLSLKIEEVPDDIRPALERNIEKIGAVVESSLDFARAGSVAGVGQRIAVRDFLECWHAEKNDLRITLRDVQDAHLTINPAALERIIANLVENALKFGTHVTIDSTAAPVTISILDDGPGIPEPDLHRVLEPFATLNEARTADKSGTGLGLAISNLLLRQAGGSLELSNIKDGGLCARITFG
ncbi:MAG: ATP-binding protein [Litoreibacter sp.]|nr:ATP-binding protein [Litoreibacter sp.]